MIYKQTSLCKLKLMYILSITVNYTGEMNDIFNTFK